jgi:hypothetical protein
MEILSEKINPKHDCQGFEKNLGPTLIRLYVLVSGYMHVMYLAQSYGCSMRRGCSSAEGIRV